MNKAKVALAVDKTLSVVLKVVGIVIAMDSINESVSMRHIKPHLYEKV